MEAGAGLPVLGPLDTLLEQRALSEEEAPSEDRTVRQLLDVVDDFLDGLETRLDERLTACSEGPLKTALSQHADGRLATPRQRVDELRDRVMEGHPAWEDVIDLLEDLQALREEIQHVARAAGHLAEVARLTDDIPDDEDGHAALDDLAVLEAQAAAHADPETWADKAKALERRALQAVRLDTARPERARTDPLDQTPTRTGPAPARPEAEIALNAGDVAHTPAPAGASAEANGANGHIATNGANGHAHPVERVDPAPTNRDPSPGYEPRLEQSGQTPRARGEADPRRPHRTARTGHDAPAGRDVLTEWERVPTDASLRHGPFWAPIAEGEVVPAEGTPDELIDAARETEVDLVDLELPRVLAVPTGGGPEAVRRRIADRAEEISRNEPERPAREALLDYLIGKLPKRYRETTTGLTLVESIAHAVTTDDAWTTAGPDYASTVRSMIAAELERTPAVDLDELATSLVGASPDARETIAEQAAILADDDPRITFHDEGILVRALAAREDPDALYDLKESLKRRLDPDRADELVATLITTGEETT